MDIFEKIRESNALLAYFSHSDCHVCKTLKPKAQRLIEEQEGFEFLYINIHEYPEVSGQYLVFTVPTMIIFMDGREVKRFSRYVSMNELEDFLKTKKG